MFSLPQFEIRERSEVSCSKAILLDYQLLLGGTSFKLKGIMKGGVIGIGVYRRRSNREKIIDENKKELGIGQILEEHRYL